jgi:hypothetical protein
MGSAKFGTHFTLLKTCPGYQLGQPISQLLKLGAFMAR